MITVIAKMDQMNQVIKKKQRKLINDFNYQQTKKKKAQMHATMEYFGVKMLNGLEIQFKARMSTMESVIAAMEAMNGNKRWFAKTPAWKQRKEYSKKEKKKQKREEED